MVSEVMPLIRWIARWVKRAAVALAALVVIAAVPIVWNETQCVGSLPAGSSGYQSILPAEHRRNLVDTYLTYPEWSIVHAYEDFAGVLRHRSEAEFAYLESIRGYWRNLCSVSAIASSQGTITADVRAMLYIIGISFTGEMGVKGAYETTIGRLTEWIRGPQRTAEDSFALAIAARYAEFLKQTPWYEFPFGQTLGRFWRETPMFQVSIVRSLERRLALSAEYGVKAVYAQLMAQAAALAPATLTIRSVVDRLDDRGIGEEIRMIERRADGSVVIESPRYRAFTEVVLKLVARGVTFIEVAGNDRILVTILSDGDIGPLPTDAQELFRVRLQADPGRARHGIVVPVKELGSLIRTSLQADAVFEHAYDY